MTIITAWTPCAKQQPIKDGTYLVTTCNGKIRLDRYSNGYWGLCLPHAKNREQGRYKQHRAWAELPEAYEDKTNGIRET